MAEEKSVPCGVLPDGSYLCADGTYLPGPLDGEPEWERPWSRMPLPERLALVGSLESGSDLQLAGELERSGRADPAVRSAVGEGLAAVRARDRAVLRG